MQRMAACQNRSPYDPSQWQATLESFVRHLKSLHSVEDTSLASLQKIPRKLTTEAFLMIYVILIFAALSIIGTLLSLYERLCKENENSNSSRDERRNGIATCKTTKEMTNAHHFIEAWLSHCREFFNCFCVVTNGRSLLSFVSREDGFDCLHGIRVLSNIWITLGHVSIFYVLALRNSDGVQGWLEMKFGKFFFSGNFANCSFFVLSGFLNGYSFSSDYLRRKGNIDWLYFYIKRYIRLTPAYMIVLGTYTTLFSYMGSGRLWPIYDTNPVCSENWWWNLLFINNFQPTLKQCMGWCWYLANDMQFYVISPIFLISLLRWPRMGYTLSAAFISASCIITFEISKKFRIVDGLSSLEYYFVNMEAFLDQYWEYFDKIHDKPYSRLGVYLIGLLLGHYVYQRRLRKMRSIQPMTLCCGWLLSASMMLISLFSLSVREKSVFISAVFNVVKNVLFSCGLSWIIFVCTTGNGSIINKCLSSRIFLPLSRISYCAYLTHMIVLMAHFQVTGAPEHFNFISWLFLCLRVVLWTYGVSFVVSLIFETPVLRLFALCRINWNKKRV
ncbi:nose resistant to fluoxetine protein 6 [Nephila pilipes]|uniref:Nose resistant to fluoxetine protein 6 n=1 Tax=Nephila pilipes TaxID=299642 RepID=A0A8X6T5K2_NEPPI|nr:nose resistant to fluoxetine protein 6 [Nephila pilipes]